MQFKKAVDFIFKKLSAELPAKLSYHTIDHIRNVYNAAELIGKQEGISADDMQLLLTAAAYHDSGFIKAAAGHEEESCRLAAETLPYFGYKPGDIEKICGMIRATKIPQSPKNHLEEILADADLDYLGRDDFFTIGDKLFKELLASGVVNNEDDWHQVQVRFFENHHYFTKTSVNLREAKKEEHLKQVKAKLNL
jgi:uncharacterized protein